MIKIKHRDPYCLIKIKQEIEKCNDVIKDDRLVSVSTFISFLIPLKEFSVHKNYDFKYYFILKNFTVKIEKTLTSVNFWRQKKND